MIFRAFFKNLKRRWKSDCFTTSGSLIALFVSEISAKIEKVCVCAFVPVFCMLFWILNGTEMLARSDFFVNLNRNRKQRISDSSFCFCDITIRIFCDRQTDGRSAGIVYSRWRKRFLDQFLSDPGVPGVRSMGPVVSHWLRPTPFAD